MTSPSPDPAAIPAPGQASAPAKPYGVGDDGSLQFDPHNLSAGLLGAYKDGLIDDDRLKTLLPKAQAAEQAAKDRADLQARVGADGFAKAKAFATGAGRGAAFLAGALPAGEAAAAAAAPLAPVTFGIAPFAAGALGGLVGGYLTQHAASAVGDELAKHSDTIKSFADASQALPKYDAAGNLVSMIVPGAAGLANVARVGGIRAAAVAAGDLTAGQAIKTTAKEIGSQALAGAAFEGAVRPAFDYVVNQGKAALGITPQAEEVQTPTMRSTIESAILGVALGNLGTKFKGYDADGINGLMGRVRAGEKLTPDEMSAVVEARDKMNAAAASGQTMLTPDFAVKVRQAINRDGGVRAQSTRVSGQAFPDGSPALDAPPVAPAPAAPQLLRGQTPAEGSGSPAPAPSQPASAQPPSPQSDSPTPPVEGSSPAAPAKPDGSLLPAPASPDAPSGSPASVLTPPASTPSIPGVPAGQAQPAVATAPEAGDTFVHQGARYAITGGDADTVSLRPSNAPADAPALSFPRALVEGQLRGGQAQLVKGVPAAAASGTQTPTTAGEPPANVPTPPAGEQPVGSPRNAAQAEGNMTFQNVQGEPINSRRTAFSADSGTLGIPRDQMPQVAAEHRGAMANWLAARGSSFTPEDMSPGSLKPSQADFQPSKVEQARKWAGDSERRILTSSDNHVIDGHHQWMGHLAEHPDQPIGTLRINAPARDILSQLHEFPSAGMEKAPDIDEAQNPSTQKGSTHEQPTAAAQESQQGGSEATPANRGVGPAEPGGSGLAERQQRRRPRDLRERVALAERAELAAGNEHLAAAQEFHAAEIAHHGATFAKGANGDYSGISLAPDSAKAPVIRHAPETFARSAQAVKEAGGSPAEWAKSAVGEEMIHHRDVVASGTRFDATHQAIYDSLSKPQREAVAEAYPDNLHPVVQAAEYLRMLSQQRAGVPLTESHFRDTAKLEAILRAPQPKVVEDHLAKMERLAPASAPAPQVLGSVPGIGIAPSRQQPTKLQHTAPTKGQASLPPAQAADSSTPIGSPGAVDQPTDKTVPSTNYDAIGQERQAKGDLAVAKSVGLTPANVQDFENGTNQTGINPQRFGQDGLTLEVQRRREASLSPSPDQTTAPTQKQPAFREGDQAIYKGRAATIQAIKGERATVKLRPTPTLKGETRMVPLASLTEKPVRSFTLPDAPQGSQDVIDLIHDNGGIIGKGEAERRAKMKGLAGGAGADYNDLPGLKGIYQQKVFGGKREPNQMAHLLHERHGVGDGSVGEMYRAIDEAMQSRRSGKAEENRQLQAETQASRFSRDTARKGRGKKEIHVGNLAVGDVVQVTDQKMKVIDVDPDTLDVTLEDHSKYGVQKVEDGQVLFVEKVKKASAGAMDGFPSETAQTAAAPHGAGKVSDSTPASSQEGVSRETTASARNPSEDKPSSTSRPNPSAQPTQPAPDFNLESVTGEQLDAERERARQKEKLAEGQARRLSGKEIDTTGDMLDPLAADNPLFSQPLRAAIPKDSRLQVAEKDDGYRELAATNATVTGPATFTLSAAKPLVAYHGTPHEVDRFSSDKIGTGEGAQVFGYGLYFAESQSVAKSYQTGLTEKDLINKVRSVYQEGDDPEEAEEELKNAGLSEGQQKLVAALKKDDWLGFDYPHQAVSAALRTPQFYDLGDDTKAALRSFGNLYAVHLDADPDELLDWDAPISRQSPKVQAAVNAIMDQRDADKERFRSIFDARAQRYRDGDATGESFYRAISQPDIRQPNNSRAASEMLRKAGICGLRYLDQASRGAGKGTRNFVMFDDSRIQITHRNGEPVKMAEAVSTPPALRASNPNLDAGGSLPSKSNDPNDDERGNRPQEDRGANEAARRDSPQFQASVARRGGPPDPGSRPFGPAIQRDVARQSEALTQAALTHGQILRPQDVARMGPVIGQGQEHQVRVLPGGERVAKMTVGGRGGYGIVPYVRGESIGLRPGTPAEYFERLALQNQVFDDDIRFEGVFKDGRGETRLVTSQPFVKGEKPTAAEIGQTMEGLGFEPINGQEGNAFYRASDNVAVFDAHTGNLVKGNGGIVPIDVVAVHPDDRLLSVIERGIEGSSSSPEGMPLFAANPSIDHGADNPVDEPSTWAKVSEALARLTTKEGVVGSALDDIAKVFVPAARGEHAKLTAEALQQVTATMARNQAQQVAVLKGMRTMVTRMPAADQRRLLFDLDEGKAPENPDLAKSFERFRQLDADRLDSMKETLKGYGVNDLNDFNRYADTIIPHLFKDPDKAEQVFSGLEKKMSGGTGFLKPRSQYTYRELARFGLEPKTNNFVDLAAARWWMQERFLGALQLADEMEKAGTGHWETGDYAPKVNEEEIGHRLLSKTGQKDGKPRKLKFFAREEAARVVKNYLSDGLRGKPWFQAYLGAANRLNGAQLGLSFFHGGFITTESITSQLANAIHMAAHGDFARAASAAVRAPMSPVLDYKLGRRLAGEWAKPGSQGEAMANLLRHIISGGGRGAMDSIYNENDTEKFLDAVRSKAYATAVLRAPFAAVEQLARPIMEKYVPYLKMAAAAKMIQAELERNPNATPVQLRGMAAEAVRSTNNRFGQMVYDNLHLHKVVKDILMGMTRSLGWNWGTFAEIGGGVKDFLKAGIDLAPKFTLGAGGRGGKGSGGGGGNGAGGGTEEDPWFSAGGVNVFKGKAPQFTQKMAYVLALPLVAGIMGAVLNAAFGQKAEQLKDYYFPKTGDKDAKGRPIRLSLPTYMKDVFAFADSPTSTITNKLHPLLSMIAQMYQNRDFYGTEIRHQDDPYLKQIIQELRYVGGNALPFTITNLAKTSQDGASPLIKALGFVGFGKAATRIGETDAEKLADSLIQDRMPQGARTQEQADKTRLKGTVLNAARQNDLAPLRAAVEAGRLTAQESRNITTRARLSPLQDRVHSLGLDDAQKVFAVATPAEKQELAPVMDAKYASARKAGRDTGPDPDARKAAASGAKVASTGTPRVQFAGF